MSYILFATSTGSGVQNPMTANLDAAGFEITGAGSVSSSVVIAGDELTHTNPAGAIGFYGVPATPQAAPVPPLVGHGEVGDAINQIVVALQLVGLMA